MEEYINLGILITNQWEGNTELERQIIKHKCAGALNHLIRERNCTRKVRITLYKNVIQSTLLYGSETWVLNKKYQYILLRRERKFLRLIYGGKKGEEGQIVKYMTYINAETY